jgi:hypothetical protein
VSEFKGQTSIVINASPEATYQYLVDFRRHPEWAQNLSKVIQTSRGPIGVGTTFKTQEGPPPVTLGQKLRMMRYFILGVLSGAKTFSEAKITVLEPPRRIAWQAGVPKGVGYLSFAEWEFHLEPQGADTHLTQRFRYTPSDPIGQRMVGAVGVEGIERACAISLMQLKRHLEQSNNHKR